MPASIVGGLRTEIHGALIRGCTIETVGKSYVVLTGELWVGTREGECPTELSRVITSL